jgi:hypothetical protein
MTIVLSNASYQTVVIDWATADHTAFSVNHDYVAGNGTLIFAPGEVSKVITLTVNGNITSTKDFFVNLSNPFEASLGKAQGVVTIISNNTPINLPPALPVPIVNGNPVDSYTSPLPFSKLTAAFVSPTTDFAMSPSYQFDFTDMVGIVVTPVKMINASTHNNEELAVFFTKQFTNYLVEGSFEIFLTDPPTAPVTIKLTSLDIPEEFISPKTVTFTPSNWNIPQDITVKVPENIDLKDLDVIHILALPAKSQDPRYDGFQPRNVDMVIPSQDHIGDKSIDEKQGKGLSDDLKSPNKGDNGQSISNRK